MKITRPPPLDLSGPTLRAVSDPAREAELDLSAPPAPETPALPPLAQTPPVVADKPTRQLPSVEHGFEPTRAPSGPGGWPIYLVAFAVSAIWALAPIAFAWGYRREIVPFHDDGFALAVLALLAIGPIGLVWLAAYLAHQGARLSSEARRSRALAETLLEPAAIAARGAGSAAQAVRAEIEQVAAAAHQAGSQLIALRELLAAESARLAEAAQSSNSAAATFSQGISSERQKLERLSGDLETKAAGVTDAVSRQARMVAEASDLAATQIREAEAALAARAADLAAAAGEAGDAARLAGDTLVRQVARLETAALSVGDQTRAMEEGLTEHRAALVTLAHGMRADQETFSTEAESLRARLTEAVAQARDGAAEMGQTATQGADVLRQMIATSGEHLRELAKEAQGEQEKLATGVNQSLAAVTGFAAREREALEERVREAMAMLAASAEEARRIAESHLQAAREKIDHLGEAAFSAGQQADAAYQARLAEARGIIEQSAQLVDEAGAHATARLNQGVVAARTAIAQLEEVLGEVDRRIAHAPAEAEAQAKVIRQNVERGIEALMESARKASAETQDIDAAFQERVRQNYDMLSEAVRLMGVVAGTSSSAAKRSAVKAPEPPSAATNLAARPRLKLTPTATDEEFKTIFDAAGGREAESPAEGWTWKELLSSMGDAPADDNDLADSLIREIEAMGIDAAALVPRARVEEIAKAMTAGEPNAGRQIVRRLAPAAIRRLSRRIITDAKFRSRTDQYVRRYEGLLVDTAKRDGDSHMASTLLGSDQGRAFLLLDAAITEPI
ncbi:MAG TPA: polar localization protein TipN [Caulobacteraceae bacterium]|nr:polar localization protein TipN [Caulobacteraceae bacterium]